MRAPGRGERVAAQPIPSEHEEQVWLVAWARLAERSRPELSLLLAVPNGGHRHAAVAAKLRQEGVRPGVPDLLLPVARGGHHGLWIELKRRQGGSISRDQRAWHEALAKENYAVRVCRGAAAALAVLEDYLKGELR